MRSLVDDSFVTGPRHYFCHYSYLETIQRGHIESWAERLQSLLEDILKVGIVDGSILRCETALVVQLILGMLIWLAKWAPGVPGLTADRLMAAIDAFSIHGLEGREEAKLGLSDCRAEHPVQELVLDRDGLRISRKHANAMCAPGWFW